MPFSSVTNNLQANGRAIFGNVFDLQTLFYVTHEAQEGRYPYPKQKEINIFLQAAVWNYVFHYNCRARLDIAWSVHCKGSYLFLAYWISGDIIHKNCLKWEKEIGTGEVLCGCLCFFLDKGKKININLYWEPNFKLANVGRVLLLLMTETPAPPALCQEDKAYIPCKNLYCCSTTQKQSKENYFLQKILDRTWFSVDGVHNNLELWHS